MCGKVVSVKQFVFLKLAELANLISKFDNDSCGNDFFTGLILEWLFKDVTIYYPEN